MYQLTFSANEHEVVSSVSRFPSAQSVENNCARLLNPTQLLRRRESFLEHVSMTSEQIRRNSDTFLTGMHLAVITGVRFCTENLYVVCCLCDIMAHHTL